MTTYLFETNRLYARLAENTDKNALKDAMMDWPLYGVNAPSDTWANEEVARNSNVTFPAVLGGGFQMTWVYCLRDGDDVIGIGRGNVEGTHLIWESSAVCTAHRGQGYFGEACNGGNRFFFGRGITKLKWQTFRDMPQSKAQRTRDTYLGVTTLALHYSGGNQVLTKVEYPKATWDALVVSDATLAAEHFRDLYPDTLPTVPSD